VRSYGTYCTPPDETTVCAVNASRALGCRYAGRPATSAAALCAATAAADGCATGAAGATGAAAARVAPIAVRTLAVRATASTPLDIFIRSSSPGRGWVGIDEHLYRGEGVAVNRLRGFSVLVMKSVWAGVVLAVVLNVAACDNRQTGTGTDGPSATVTAGNALPRITIRRTGGFAGVDDQLVVEPNGAWTATDKLDKRRSGQLTPDQVAAVRALATAPARAGEAGHSAGLTNCMDAFTYAVTIGSEQIGYVDCPSDSGLPAATIALVNQVQQLTTGG
jgi:hypothetical protein